MSKPLHVLIVEDSEDDTALVLRLLRRGGFDVTHERVETAEAMRAALTSPLRAGGTEGGWDIVLSDYHMPRFDGLAALRVLQESGLDLPFILVSGTVGEDLAVTIMKAGAHDYLLKDKLARLPAAVERELREAEVRRERWRAEGALRESEERFRLLFNSGNDAIFIHPAPSDDQPITFVEVNDVACDRLGYTRDELLRMSPLDIDDPEIAAQRAATVQDFMARQHATFETAHVAKDGRKIPVEINARLFELKRQPMVISIARDITERKRAEAELVKLRKAVETSGEAIFMTNRDGIITYVNPEFTTLYGYTAAEVIGKTSPRILKSGRMTPQDYERFWQTLLSKQVVKGEIVNKTKDARFIHIEGSASPILDDKGDIVGFLAIQRDITERKRAEELIRQNAACAEALVRTAARLNAQLDLDTVLNAVCEETVRALNIHAASVTLLNVARGEFNLMASVGLPDDYVRRHKPIPQTRYDELAQSAGAVVVVPDAQQLANWHNAELYARHNVRTVAGAKMEREGALFGTLNVYALGETRTFTDDELALLRGIADQAAQAIINAQLFEQLQRRVGELSVLSEMDRQMAASLHVRDILDFAVKTIPRIVGAEACSLLLWDERQEVLVAQAVEGRPAESVGKALYRQGEGLVGWVFLERRVANVPNVAADTRWKDKYDEDRQLPSGRARCALAVPLILGDKTLGVLDVVNKTLAPSPAAGERPQVRVFTEADEALLTSVATQMAVALENARLYEDVRNISVATIRCLAVAIDARDPYTRGHSEGVTRLAVQLARDLGWSGNDLEMMEFAALLHDVGKIGVPDEILRKPGPLTPDEWTVMRLHPYHSRQIVKPVEPLRRILPWIYHHHERMDGTGYPDGIKGEAIPLAARIIAVADVWDALTSARPYRTAWSKERARQHIEEQAGKHFDPKVVEVFLHMVKE